MKILQIHPIMKTLNGSERVVIELTSRFVRDGYEVQICTLRIANECKWELQRHAKLTELGLNFGGEGFWATGLQYVMLPLLTLKTSEYDIIILHGYPSVLASVFLKKRKGVKSIYLCYEPPRFAYDLLDKTEERFRFIERYVFRLLARFAKVIDYWAIRKVDNVVVMSRYSETVTEGLYGVKPTLIYLGVDPLKFSQSESNGEEVRTKYQIGKSFLLLSVGKLHLRKNFELQLCAMKRLIKTHRNIHLMIVGDGPYKNELKNLAKRLCISAYVTFTGFVHEDDLPKFYGACDLFVFTAHKEPFGLVVIEAMATGKAVVVPNEGGPLETIVNGKTGLIYEQGNIEDLCNKIRYLMDFRKERRRMETSARQRALQFSWENYYKQILRLT